MSLGIYAQQLLFINESLKQAISVKPGQTLALSYKGYNGNLEFAKQTVTDIDDSTITLGVNPEHLSFLKRKNGTPLLNQYKVIRIADIQAFRRITVARGLLKSTLRVGMYLGSVVLLYDLSGSANVGPARLFFTSVGLALGSYGLIELILPESTKYTMADGWTVHFAK